MSLFISHSRLPLPLHQGSKPTLLCGDETNNPEHSNDSGVGGEDGVSGEDMIGGDDAKTEVGLPIVFIFF